MAGKSTKRKAHLVYLSSHEVGIIRPEAERKGIGLSEYLRMIALEQCDIEIREAPSSGKITGASPILNSPPSKIPEGLND